MLEASFLLRGHPVGPLKLTGFGRREVQGWPGRLQALGQPGSHRRWDGAERRPRGAQRLRL